MAQALSATQYIYQGVWTNWSKDRGVVLGSTLTVNSYFASLLSPAIALFISIAGSQLWRLFQFALHQARATSDNRQLLYHQQQVMLRNTATDLNTIYRLIRTAFAWRHQKNVGALRLTLPLVLWSLMHFSFFVLAGLFSTWLLEAGDDVLSRSSWCGEFSNTYVGAIIAAKTNITDDGLRLGQEYAHYHNARYAYVQQHIDICENGENGTEGCDMMPARSLDWRARILPGTCPFNDDLCHELIEGALSLETGPLSSLDLGFNAPKKDRIAFKMSAQCAPMNDAKNGDWQYVPASADEPGKEVASVFYGRGAYNVRNATFSQTKQYMDCDERLAAPAYVLNSVFASTGGNISNQGANFDPVDGLQRVGADISLISLVTNSRYTSRIADPWFSAQQQISDTNAFCMGINETLFVRERPITTMGCTQQWQLCNTESPDSDDGEQCTAAMGLASLQGLFQGTTRDVDFNPRQLATAKRVLTSAVSSSFYYVINALSNSGGQPLQAMSKMAYNYGPALPADQWQIEAKNWMQIAMGILQQTSLDFSTGQFAADTSYINTTAPLAAANPQDPDLAAAQWLCQNQIIHSKVYKNYNFFALIMLVVVCTIAIILGLCIEDVIGYMRQRSLRHSGETGKHGMWNTNSDLEMLKTIDEIRNHSTWGISRNGVWLGPPGYTVGINDLKAESQDVEKDTGFVLRAVKRRQTEQSMAPSSPCKHGMARCFTCNLSESPSAATSPLRGTPNRTPTRSDAQNHFENAFKNAIPQVRVTEADAPSQYSHNYDTQPNTIPLPPHVRSLRSVRSARGMGRTERFPIVTSGLL